MSILDGECIGGGPSLVCGSQYTPCRQRLGGWSSVVPVTPNGQRKVYCNRLYLLVFDCGIYVEF